MVLWFVGTSILAVWSVFHDPSIDVRLVLIGSLVPDVVDVFLGGPAHSVTVAVGALTVSMIATVGHRTARKRAVMFVVGMFLHLVFDGAVANSRLFWWPFSGLSSPRQRIPSLDRGATSAALEVVGAVLCVWHWRRFRLGEPTRRSDFVRRGRLSP